MPQPFRCDLNLVQRTSNMIAETEPIARGGLPPRPLQGLHQPIIFHDVEGLFQGLRVIRPIGHFRYVGHVGHGLMLPDGSVRCAAEAYGRDGVGNYYLAQEGDVLRRVLKDESCGVRWLANHSV